MKKIKESGSVAIGGGNFNSDGPSPQRKTNKYFSGHGGGGYHGLADNTFGGVMGIGKNFPVDYFEDEDTEDDLDLLLQEFKMGDAYKAVKKTVGKNLGKFYNVGKSALFSLPVFGDIGAGLNFLFRYFGPFGLRVAVRKFVSQLSEYTGVHLGNDFLEPEGFDKKLQINLADMSDEEFTEYLRSALSVFDNIDSDPKLSEKLTVSNIESILDGYDAILDDIRHCFIAFFGSIDAAIGQSGFLVNMVISFIEPEDFVDWMVNKYAKEILPKIKQKIPDENSFLEMLGSLGDYAKVPLDKLGNLDLLFNEQKLIRFAIIHDALDKLKERKDMLTGDDKDGKINKIVNVILDKLLEENKNYSISTLMESYLNEDNIDESEEESFDELDLEEGLWVNISQKQKRPGAAEDEPGDEEEDIDEMSTTASIGGGPALPLGKSTKKKPDGKHIRMSEQEKIVKEQIKRMRILEAYHQKTSNRLK